MCVGGGGEAFDTAVDSVCVGGVRPLTQLSIVCVCGGVRPLTQLSIVCVCGGG